MVKLADSGIDLFSGEMPTLEQLDRLSRYVHCSEINKIEFSEILEQNSSDSVRCGIGLYLLGRYCKAVEHLENAASDQTGLIYLGKAFQAMKQFDKAIEAFDKAQNAGADALFIRLAKSATYRQAGDFNQAEEEIKSCSNFEKVSADFHYQRGRLKDAQGNYEEAINDYEAAVELDSNHTRALFQLAYSCDLRGDDIAVQYYKQLVSISPTHVNALLNLAVIYEDNNAYQKAMRCVEAVLKSHPNHTKAQLFKKDIASSMVMIYDEEKEKQLDRQNQILEIPISDFELSVRSRNCLRKMNIRTLGDLLRITEAELLSYKNFGETSLNEIKKILDSKNLTLGMAIENKLPTIMEDQPNIEGADEALLNKTVEDMELSVRSRRCLTRLGLRTVGDLAAKTEAELLGCKNFGVTSLNEIKERLTSYGLSLRKLD